MEMDEPSFAERLRRAQNVPGPLSIHVDATCELGHTDASLLPFRLYEVGGLLTIYHAHWIRLLQQK